MSALYLLHFDPPYEHARHYLGFTARDVDTRVLEHLDVSCSRGSPLVRAAVLAGCEIRLARTWSRGTRTEERRLKRSGGLSRHCPLCRASGAYHH